jgi:hypothetical protein
MAGTGCGTEGAYKVPRSSSGPFENDLSIAITRGEAGAAQVVVRVRVGNVERCDYSQPEKERHAFHK